MNGILAVYNDVEPSMEAEFNRWYNCQHVLERVAVTGFRSGRRYRAIGKGHRYFACYETDSSDILVSTQYLRCLENPTDWTRKVMPHFRNMVRTVMNQACKAGTGYGGYVGTLALQPADLNIGADATHQWLAAHGLSDAVDGVNIVAAEYWLRDRAHDTVATTESQLRDGPDAALAANIVLHATNPQAPLEVAKHLQAGVEATGAKVGGSMNCYQLLFSAG